MKTEGPTSKPIIFLASFPSIQSAIKRGIDGMRITLDIPESEMANAVELMALMNKRLQITVEIATEKASGRAERKKIVSDQDFQVKVDDS